MMVEKEVCGMLNEECILTQLTPFDGIEFYEMLQHIGRQENDFTNPVHGMDFDEFRTWLKQQDDWSRGENLPHGYVPQVCFWLIADEIPVGFGKIRLSLTAQSRFEGGNLGYAVDSRKRGHGYGSKLLELLLVKAKELMVYNPLITIKKYNIASKRVAENNGARLIHETEDWWYLEVDNK